MNNSFDRFKQSESGSIAIIVGLCLMAVVFGTLALSVDLPRSQTGFNKVNDAADAAAQGVAQFIQQYQVNYAKTVNSDPAVWQTAVPGTPELQSVADRIYVENLTNDQNSATPVPYGSR